MINTTTEKTNSAANSADLEKISLSEVFEQLNSSADGLTSSEAAKRILQYGKNELLDKEESAIIKFLKFFWGPIAWMIEAAAILSLAMEHWSDLTIITVLLFYNAISGFWQERKASNALAELKAGLAPKANALRDGKFSQIDAADVVPGDIIQVKIGEVIPADIRFVDGEYISIDQSALTGESLPVSKKIGEEGYSGSIVKKGEMKAVVIGTGNNTFFGRTASLVATAGNKSHSAKATARIGDFLIIISVILCVFLAGSELYNNIVLAPSWHWHDIAIIARMVLVLLIASIPVAMPSVITVTNSLGAQALASKKAIVSRLEAIEELAGVDVLCSDKTGTLTKNLLTLGDSVLFGNATADQIILAGALASEKGSNEAIDKAVVSGLKNPTELDNYKVTKFMPFDPVSKRTESHVTDSLGNNLIFSKGAPQVIVGLCKLDAETEKKANDTVASLASKGFRALGVAKSEDEGKTWTFLGILSLLDPPRDDSKATIQQAKEHGLRVKMVTGDDVAIGNQISGMLGMGNHLVAASDLFSKDMDVNNLPIKIDECVDKADGFARVFPEHKYGIVKSLQALNHVVAMTGDGVNDAPALKQADCGIAVSGATDAARAAADLILTAPGLSTIIDAIDNSRKIFERIINYIMYRIAMTLDIMFVVVLATILLGFSPLTPIMIILLALLDDIPIMTIAYDNTLLPKIPVRWHMRNLLYFSSFMGILEIVQSFGLLIIGMEWLSNPDWQSWIHLTKEQVQTAVFLQLAAGGHLLLLVIRSRKSLFSKPWPATPLFTALFGTQILAVLFCGFGWFVEPLPWTIIGLVWLYMIVWVIVIDLIKIAIYKRKERDPKIKTTRHE